MFRRQIRAAIGRWAETPCSTAPMPKGQRVSEAARSANPPGRSRHPRGSSSIRRACRSRFALPSPPRTGDHEIRFEEEEAPTFRMAAPPSCRAARGGNSAGARPAAAMPRCQESPSKKLLICRRSFHIPSRPCVVIRLLLDSLRYGPSDNVTSPNELTYEHCM